MAPRNVLSDVEVRVLGCLVEKEIASAKANPLTLNALTLACNQRSNRDPVVDFDEATVVRGLNGLREKKLAVMVHKAGSRVPKYEHLLREKLDLTRKELALLCELMLRGPQTLGELRAHADRMYAFVGLDEVEEAVEGLQEEERGFVKLLPRRAGQKERRYAHLLAGQPEVPEENGAPSPEPAVLRVREEDRCMEELRAELRTLREELRILREAFDTFRSQFD